MGVYLLPQVNVGLLYDCSIQEVLLSVAGMHPHRQAVAEVVASSGVRGKDAAGARVVMTGRDPARLGAARDRLLAATGVSAEAAVPAILEGGDPDSVRAAVARALDLVLLQSRRLIQG